MLPQYTTARSRAFRKQLALDMQAELVGRYVDALFVPSTEKLVSMFDSGSNRLWCQTVATQPQLAEVLAFAAATAPLGSRVWIVRKSDYEFIFDGLRGGYAGLNDITLHCREKGLFDLELSLAGPIKEIESIESAVEPFDSKTYTPSKKAYEFPPESFNDTAAQIKARRIRRRDDWIKTAIIALTIVIIVVYSIYTTS